MQIIFNFLINSQYTLCHFWLSNGLKFKFNCSEFIFIQRANPKKILILGSFSFEIGCWQHEKINFGKKPFPVINTLAGGRNEYSMTVVI